MFKHVTENGKMNVILISNEEHFDCKQIKKSLQECGVEEDDILVHTLQINNSKKTVKSFIRKNRGVLICQSDLYTGMEGKWVCYCVSDKDWERNVRVNIMRACEKLNILYCYKEEDESYNNFMSARMDPEFLKKCNNEIEKYGWKCLTCEKIAKKNKDTKMMGKDMIVCKTCIVGCHIGHKCKRKEIKKGNVICTCKENYPCCLFKRISNK